MFLSIIIKIHHINGILLDYNEIQNFTHKVSLILLLLIDNIHVQDIPLYADRCS